MLIQRNKQNLARLDSNSPEHGIEKEERYKNDGFQQQQKSETKQQHQYQHCKLQKQIAYDEQKLHHLYDKYFDHNAINCNRQISILEEEPEQNKRVSLNYKSQTQKHQKKHISISTKQQTSDSFHFKNYQHHNPLKQNMINNNENSVYSLKQELYNCSKEIMRLTHISEEREEDIKLVLQQSSIQYKELERQNEINEEQREIIQELQQTQRSLLEELKQYDRKNKHVMEQLESMNEEHTKEKDLLRNTMKEHIDEVTSEQNIQTQKAQETIDNYKNDLTNCQLSLQKMQAEGLSLKQSKLQEKDKLEMRISELLTQKEALHVHNLELARRITVLEGDLTTGRNNIATLNLQLEKGKQSMADCVMERQKQENLIILEQEQYDTNINNLQAQFQDELQTREADFMDIIHQLQRENENLLNNIKELHFQNSTAERRHFELLNQKQKEIEEMRNERKANDANQKEFMSQMQNAQKQQKERNQMVFQGLLIEMQQLKTEIDVLGLQNNALMTQTLNTQDQQE